MRFEQAVTLSPGEQQDVVFEPGRFPQLALNQPRLWWPAQMGTPELHELELELMVERPALGLARPRRFGIREVQVRASTPTSDASSPSTASAS